MAHPTEAPAQRWNIQFADYRPNGPLFNRASPLSPETAAIAQKAGVQITDHLPLGRIMTATSPFLIAAQSGDGGPDLVKAFLSQPTICLAGEGLGVFFLLGGLYWRSYRASHPTLADQIKRGEKLKTGSGLKSVAEVADDLNKTTQPQFSDAVTHFNDQYTGTGKH